MLTECNTLGQTGCLSLLLSVVTAHASAMAAEALAAVLKAYVLEPGMNSIFYFGVCAQNPFDQHWEGPVKHFHARLASTPATCGRQCKAGGQRNS